MFADQRVHSGVSSGNASARCATARSTALKPSLPSDSSDSMGRMNDWKSVKG